MAASNRLFTVSLRRTVWSFLNVHKSPSLFIKNNTLLKKNMCIALQWKPFKNWSNVKLINPSNSENMPRFALLAGILSWLGLQKEEAEDPVVLTIKRAILLMQREDFDSAEQMLHLALKLAEERVDQQAVTYIYDVMANLAYKRLDFPKAESLFVEVMKRLLANGVSKNDNAVVEISLKLSNIYAQQSQDQKAIEGFSFCITTQAEKLSQMKLLEKTHFTEIEENTLVLWAMSVDYYARYLLAKGHYQLAEENFEKAFQVSEKVNGPSGDQTLVLMNDIGTVATLRKDFDKAVNVLQQAIDRGRESSDLPAFYCNLGATYLRKGDSELAHAACSKALRLSRKMKHTEAETDARSCLEEVIQLEKK